MNELLYCLSNHFVNRPQRVGWRGFREVVIAEGSSACEAGGMEGANDTEVKTSTSVSAEAIQFRVGWRGVRDIVIYLLNVMPFRFLGASRLRRVGLSAPIASLRVATLRNSAAIPCAANCGLVLSNCGNIGW
jgi:hypothetical protein